MTGYQRSSHLDAGADETTVLGAVVESSGCRRRGEDRGREETRALGASDRVAVSASSIERPGRASCTPPPLA